MVVCVQITRGKDADGARDANERSSQSRRAVKEKKERNETKLSPDQTGQVRVQVRFESAGRREQSRSKQATAKSAGVHVACLD